jgi:hypothetical protein
MTAGFEEIDAFLDPAFDVPQEVEPDLVDLLPKGYLSISQVTKYIKCPQSWKLVYVDQKPQRTSARMFQGIQVHEAAEAVLNDIMDTGIVPPLERATDAFADAFEKSKGLIEDWEGEDPGSVKDTGVTCAKIFHQEAAHKSTPIAVESTFHTIIKSSDGKVRLPVLGRIDSKQVQTHTAEQYEQIRLELKQGKMTDRPKRVHDLKVSTDKWNENDIKNSVQFAIYAHVEGIPDVQVDNVVKGRARVPRPRLETITGIVTPQMVRHSLRVVEDAAKSIALGHFPVTDPDNWWCSEKWCSVWQYCRGA